MAIGNDEFSNKGELLRGKLTKESEETDDKNTCIRSVVLYKPETWTMRKQDTKRLEAFEMWWTTWRRINKINWTAHRTDEEVSEMIGEERARILTIRQSIKEMDRTQA